jgi:hypothetical protein
MKDMLILPAEKFLSHAAMPHMFHIAWEEFS